MNPPPLWSAVSAGSVQLRMDSKLVVLFVLFYFAFGQKSVITDAPNCDDLLEENTRLKEEIKWLNDVITNNITQLTEMIQNNAEKINTNEGNIQDNTGNIQDNADNIGIVDSKVNSNSGQIVSTNRRIDENKAYINQNTVNIEENALHLAPVGTISAWVTKPTKETKEDKLVDLPDGWVRCDGSTIPEPSIWAGQLTPDLNGEKRFLRGASDSEELTMEEDQMQNHHHDIYDPGHSHMYDDKYPNYGANDDGHIGPPGSDTDNDRYDKSHTSFTVVQYTGVAVQGVSSGYNSGSETRPKNMNVIYIMRVW